MTDTSDTAPAAVTPGQAARDPQAEQDHAEWRGWMEANNYSTHPDDCDGMAEAFAAGMRAARDLAAAAGPQAAPEREADELAKIDEETARVLVVLGWTPPPAEGAQPAPDPRLVALDPAMLHKELREQTRDHERLLEEILENTDDEPDMSDTPEDFAVEYVRHLEAETTRLACVIRDIHLRASDALKSAEDREADGESEGADPAYRDPPRADPSGHDPHQFPTVAELGGEKFADYPSESGL